MWSETVRSALGVRFWWWEEIPPAGAALGGAAAAAPAGAFPGGAAPVGADGGAGRGRGRGRGGPYAGRGRGRGRGRGGGPPPPVPSTAPGPLVLAHPKMYRRRFAQFPQLLGSWHERDGAMNSERFLEWLRRVLDFTAQHPDFAGRQIIIHLDNASFHKKRQQNFNCVTASAMDIIFQIVNHAPAEFDFEVDDFMTDDGEPVAKARLIEIYKSVMPPEPLEIEVLAGQYHAIILWTPPYWPEQQPAELFNNNAKGDYRDRDADERGPDIGAAVRTFCAGVPEDDVQGWVEHSDQFCIAVHNRDANHLHPLVLDLLPDT